MTPETTRRPPAGAPKAIKTAVKSETRAVVFGVVGAGTAVGRDDRETNTSFFAAPAAPRVEVKTWPSSGVAPVAGVLGFLLRACQMQAQPLTEKHRALPPPDFFGVNEDSRSLDPYRPENGRGLWTGGVSNPYYVPTKQLHWCRLREESLRSWMGRPLLP